MNLENKRQLAILAFAVGLGLVAVVLASLYMENSIKQQTQQLAQDYEKVNEGLRNELSDMNRKINQLNEQQAALTRQQQVRSVVSAGGEDAVPTVAFSIKTPPGKRAITVLIDSLSAVGGLITPGDYVDVLAQLEISDDKKDKDDSTVEADITTILFQNLQVLAVGTNFEPVVTMPIYQSQQQARSLNVTLAVEPDEAGLLTFAQTNGKLKLTLRPPQEDATQPLDVATWDTLSEYVHEKQGTELNVPKRKTRVDAVDPSKSAPADEMVPFIQIFKGGRATE